MPDNKYNFYSIIIPSYNRAEEMDVLLASLLKLDFPNTRLEVIIADDGSKDETESIVLGYKKKAEFQLHYYSQQNQGPGAARNMGIGKAKGDFFIFVDSDVSVPDYWLTHIDKALYERNADAFGGPDTFRDDFPPLLKAINYSMTSFITTGGLRGKKGKKLAKYYPRSFNMGLSRTLWDKIGGFGTLRHGQDIEFSNRIIRSGARVIFIDNAGVFHKRRTNLRQFYRQVFNWGVARVNLFKIDKSMLEPLHLMPAALTLLTGLTVILAMFSTLFTWIVFWGMLLSIMVLIVSMIDSILIYKQLSPAMYLPLVMPAQIIGYGMGFIYNFIRRVIFSKGEKVGFKKHYYK